MAGDIGIREQLIIVQTADPAASRGATELGEPGSTLVRTDSKRRVLHMYGSRVIVAEEHPEPSTVAWMRAAGAIVSADPDKVPAEVLASFTPAERIGVDAFRLRQSAGYLAAKAARPHDGADWDTGAAQPPACQDVTMTSGEAQALAPAGAPTSSRLTGSVAVGIVIVEGPSANLKFSSDERTKVVAEVQNGLGWLASQSPLGVTFKYDIQVVTIATQPGADSLTSAQKEALWRDPAMAKLGFASGMSGVTAYVDKLRTSLNTTWAYCGFFTKYPLGWFAYASIGGPRLVMDYANGGWGPDNIDRVFAHETGHIFGAPDEYASASCNCSGSWGFYGKPNGNCATCAPSGGVACVMKSNSWAMCAYTPYHLGFPLVEQTYTGIWRQGTDSYYLWVNSSWNSFVTKWQQLGAQNLRLTDLKITRDGGIERFHGVWRQGTGGYYLWVNTEWSSFVAKWQELASQNLRLVDIEVQNIGGTLLYSGVWLPGSDGYYLWANADWNGFVAKWQELAALNLRLVDIKIVNVGGQQRFFGIWRAGTGGYYLWVNADWNSFVAKWQELAALNLRLVDIEITQTSSGQRFSGVWLPGADSYYLWAGADWQHFRTKWEELGGQGLRLIDLDVVPAGGAESPAYAGATEFRGVTNGAYLAGGVADEDGMGGGASAANDGAAGYGGGHLEDEGPRAKSSSGLAGVGGGSVVPGGSDHPGVGGGDAMNGSPSRSLPVVQGMGGGSSNGRSELRVGESHFLSGL